MGFWKVFRSPKLCVAGRNKSWSTTAYNGHRWENIISGVATCQPRPFVVRNWYEKGDRYLLDFRQYDSCVRLRTTDQNAEKDISLAKYARSSEVTTTSPKPIPIPIWRFRNQLNLFIFNFENLRSTQASHYIFIFHSEILHRINNFVRQVATLFHTCSGAHLSTTTSSWLSSFSDFIITIFRFAQSLSQLLLAALAFRFRFRHFNTNRFHMYFIL